MVEFQPSKLAVVGSNPIARSNAQTCGVKRETSRPSLEMVCQSVVSPFAIHVSRRGTPT